MDPGERQIWLFRQQFNFLSAFNKSLPYDQEIDKHAWLGPTSVSPKKPQDADVNDLKHLALTPFEEMTNFQEEHTIGC